MAKNIHTKDNIIQIIQDNYQRISELGVKRLGLFGSYIRGEQNSRSDIDILVEFYQDKKTFDNFIALSFLLESLLEHDIELVTSESLSHFIAPSILDEVQYVMLPD